MHALDELLENYYTEQFSLLAAAGVETYHLSEEAAEDLAHDIVMASLQQKARIDNPPLWFAAALKVAVERRARRGR